MEMKNIQRNTCASDPKNCGLYDPQAALANALKERNIQEFKDALASGADPMRPDSCHMTIFESALKEKGCNQFVKICLEHGANPNYINKKFSKSALSYATDSRDPAILETILQNKNINPNTTFSNLTPINSLAKNLTSANAKEVEACIDLLLQYGACPNISDHKDFTPILYVLKNKELFPEQKRHIIEKFLNHPNIDLDTSRDGEARLLLEEYYPDLKLPAPLSNVVGLSTLLCMLRNENEERFLGTFSAFNDFQFDEHKKNITNNSLEFLVLLVEATEKGLHRAFDAILEKVSNINVEYFEGHKHILEIVCNSGNWLALKKLLDRNDLIYPSNSNLLVSLIQKLDEDINTEFRDYKKCFDILLNWDYIDINETDPSDSIPLHYAVKCRNKHAIQELLKRGAYIGMRSKFNDIPIETMDPEILEEHFDSCITTNGHTPGDDKFKIIIDYKNFLPTKSNDKKPLQCSVHHEMNPLSSIAGSKEMKHLLKHPLVSSFLYFKWQRQALIFYLNFLFCLLFFCSITAYTILRNNSSENQVFIEIFKIFSILGILYLILRELFQFLTDIRNFFKVPSNYVEIVLIAVCIATLAPQGFDKEWWKIVAALMLLLQTYEFSVVVETLPFWSISTHMLMLKEVLRNFMKSFTLYSIFIVTASFCFYILFGESFIDSKDNENGISNNILKLNVKMIAMFTGELNAGEIQFPTTFSYFFFVSFVIFVPIVLFNLLNGLAVSDTQAIKEQAEVNNSICRCKLLTSYERLLIKKSYKNHPKFIAFFQSLINVFPFCIPGTTISISPNDRNKISFPPANGYKKDLTFHETSDIKLLPRWLSLLNGKCSEMESETVISAIAVIEKTKTLMKEKDRVESDSLRLKNIENKIESIFEILQDKTS